MHLRQEITEKFSTFAQFEANYFTQWIWDGKLRRSMEYSREKLPEAPVEDNFWMLFWYKKWHKGENKLSGLHLSAYLQEECYWAAKRINEKYSSTQYGLADYFQMGSAEVNKILTCFKPEINSSLKAYASMAFPSLLKDILRRRQESDICTNWSLLRKVSRKRLGEALQNAGLNQQDIARYKLVWDCFNQLYVPIQTSGTERLPEPDQKLWEAIATEYNIERQSLTTPDVEIKAETAQQWITKTATWVRAYLYPSVGSLSVSKSEGDSGELDVPQLRSESVLTEIIAQEEIRERNNQLIQMHRVLIEALEKLAPELQDMLRMYYKERLNQSEIGDKFGKAQNWVSRRLSRARELLLSELIKWVQELEKNQPRMYTSSNPNQLKDGTVALEEWLETRNW